MEDTSISTSALMTSKNKPNDTTVSGNVKIISNGFTIALQKPKSKAEIAKAEALSKRIPENI